MFREIQEVTTDGKLPGVTVAPIRLLTVVYASPGIETMANPELQSAGWSSSL